MFWKNKSFVVTPRDTEEVNGMAMTPIQPKTNYIYELGMLIDFNAVKITKVVITYKAAMTLFRAAEHVVVTKVK